MIAAELKDFETDENKALFAEALLREPNDAFKAAKKIFPTNIPNALWICQRWPQDEFVVAKQREFILDGGEEKYLPSKSQVARQVHNVSMETKDLELVLKSLGLYCNIRGFIEKPGTVINNNIANNVMVVKDHGTDEEWESKVIQQQKQLVESSQ